MVIHRVSVPSRSPCLTSPSSELTTRSLSTSSKRRGSPLPVALPTRGQVTPCHPHCRSGNSTSLFFQHKASRSPAAPHAIVIKGHDDAFADSSELAALLDARVVLFLLSPSS